MYVGDSLDESLGDSVDNPADDPIDDSVDDPVNDPVGDPAVRVAGDRDDAELETTLPVFVYSRWEGV
ncbi:hypothetical protein BC936DRAFT_146040 [Jimgerdemannia flammicorona]|uniref:Uncharacterized protein n=2 Tax=Jimgerdemannia flammicorona TaxID=994334 RepID=A0A433QIY3_9FUNG|nr:hypothetical protein BC936DRAFT_146040 [Jimgerdemannia flammicorona]RUS29753.1 hypothetical protein BC938DRAFT_480284 [Jimgerdemannia flammicorona]